MFMLSKLLHLKSVGFWLAGYLLVAASCLAFLVDELVFHHHYAVVAEYPGQGVQAVHIRFESERRLLGLEVRDNRYGDAASVARASFNSRKPVASVQLTLVDAAGNALTTGQFQRVAVKSRWGEAQASMTPGPVSSLEPVPGTWSKAFGRSSVKWILVLGLTTLALGALQFNRQAQTNRWPLLFLFAWVVFLTLLAGEVITDRPIYGDGVGQLRAAFNLFAHNVFAEQLANPPSPDNFIEPLPALVNSVYFRVLNWFGVGPMPFEQMHWGSLAYLTKQINLLWVLVGQLALAGFVYAKTRRVWAAALTVLLAHVFFFGNYRVVDTYYTELQGGVLLLLASMGLYALFDRFGWRSAALTGALLAMLALTKASFYYINLVVILAVVGGLLLSAMLGKRISFRRAGALSLLLVLAYAAVLGPWLARNQSLFGNATVSDRGGVVLYIRATKNQMTAEEIRGALYLYGPSVYHHLGGRWAFARPVADELDPAQGAWMRVNRNRSPNSFFASVKQELVQALSVPDDQGRTMTMNQVAADMNRKAIASILDNPVKHVGMSFVFLWRGMWGVAPVDFYGVKPHRDLVLAELAMLMFYVLATVFLLRALLRRDVPALMLGLLTLGGVGFYAGLSHFLPRYMVQFYPALVLMASLQLLALLRRKST